MSKDLDIKALATELDAFLEASSAEDMLRWVFFDNMRLMIEQEPTVIVSSIAPIESKPVLKMTEWFDNGIHQGDSPTTEDLSLAA